MPTQAIICRDGDDLFERARRELTVEVMRDGITSRCGNHVVTQRVAETRVAPSELTLVIGESQYDSLLNGGRTVTVDGAPVRLIIDSVEYVDGLPAVAHMLAEVA